MMMEIFFWSMVINLTLGLILTFVSGFGLLAVPPYVINASISIGTASMIGCFVVFGIHIARKISERDEIENSQPE
jgi:uncharacterized membrane protein (DUF485 family)